MTRPCCRRSSGTRATPAAIAASGEELGSTWPRTVTRPADRRSMPKTARATSLRPAPTSPARATISPRRTEKLMSCRTPSRPSCSTCSTTSPAGTWVLGNSWSRSRPTIDRMTSSTVMSCAADVRTNRPSRMIVTRWQLAKTSSSRCEMKSTAAPSRRSARMTSKSRSTSTVVRAAVGSSMTRTFAWADRALAISTICWSATDSPRAVRCGSSATPSRVKISPALRFIAGRSMRRPARSGCRPMKMFSATVRSGNRVGSW